MIISIFLCLKGQGNKLYITVTTGEYESNGIQFYSEDAGENWNVLTKYKLEFEGDVEMIFIQEIPVSKINEYWDIQFQYLVNDGIITTEEEKKYFQSAEYRDVL